MATEDSYWAAAQTEDFVRKAVARVDDYAESSLFSTLSSLQTRAYQYYYGLDANNVHTTSQVLRGGDVGELAAIRVNHSRSLVNTLLNLIVAPKLSWTPKAVNIDYESIKQCELAAALLEYYWVEKRVSSFSVRALEEALVFGEGFVYVDWEEQAGQDYSATEDLSATIKSGDLQFTNISSWDVIRDPFKQSYDALDWVIVRTWKSKWEIVAKYAPYSPAPVGDPEAPDAESFELDENAELRNLILSAPSDVKLESSNPTAEDSDDIPVYHFLHKRTPALPDGRHTVFLTNEAVLSDGKLDFEEWPLYRVSAGEMTGAPFGYTPYFDVLGVQELMDSLNTSIASNQSTFGTQLIAVQDGSDAGSDNLAGGMKVIYYPRDGKPPEAINLTRTPSEIFSHLQTLKKEQELLFGLNSVVRGEPQSGELSGSALALLQSQALQQSSTIQSNYLRFVQGIGDCVVYTIRTRASAPQKIAIVGKSSQFLVTETEFTGESLSRVKKVLVEIGNPMAQTAAGRSEMAKELMQMGLVKTPEQYHQVLLTGRLEPLTQSLQHELLLIRSENESLSRGEQPPALALDDHLLHAREHRAVLANPEARRSPEVTQAVLAHIQEHEQLFFTVPPTTLQMVGQTPPMPMGPPGGPGAGPAEAPPPGAEPTTPAAELPQPPKNAATGEEWNPVDGGGAVPR